MSVAVKFNAELTRIEFAVDVSDEIPTITGASVRVLFPVPRATGIDAEAKLVPWVVVKVLLQAEVFMYREAREL